MAENTELNWHDLEDELKVIGSAWINLEVTYRDDDPDSAILDDDELWLEATTRDVTLQAEHVSDFPIVFANAKKQARDLVCQRMD